MKAAAKSVEHPIRFFYASKANSNMAVLKLVLETGIDIEVNSGGELFKALRVGFRPRQIIFNGTSKSERRTGRSRARRNLCDQRGFDL